ncbi:hypothetical protein ES703_119160 [subsurface metagenome]
MKAVTTHEAKTHLSALLKRVEHGEEIQILRGEVPVAKLVPLGKAPQYTRPKVGIVTSPRIECAEDAFKPLTEGEMSRWGLV